MARRERSDVCDREGAMVDAMQCNVMQCDIVECDVMQCAAIWCDAMRCDVMRWMDASRGGVGETVSRPGSGDNLRLLNVQDSRQLE